MSDIYKHQSVFFLTLITLLIAGFSSFKVSSQSITNQLLNIRFEYPSMVAEGEKFAFVIVFEKQPGYKPAGTIITKWPPGFRPVSSVIDIGNMQIEGQHAVIKWDKLPETGIISVVYFVDVLNTKGSSFPILTEYRDVIGLAFDKVNVINVMPGEKIVTPKEPAPEIDSKVSIGADYPIEVMAGDAFSVNFKIIKGKNVSPAQLQIKLPHGIKPASSLKMPHTYDPTTSLLVINWDYLPPHPSFEFKVDLVVEKPPRAAYPFSATFFINGKAQAKFSKYIIVTEHSGKIGKPDNTDTPDLTDTTKLFSELDNLLNLWVESTGNKNQISTKQELQTPAAVVAVDEKNPTGTNLPKDGVEYRIQVFATTVPTPGLSDEYKKMGINEPLVEDFDGKTYRYSLGSFKNFESAREYLKVLRTKGLIDAFTVKYVDGKRER